jgi:hypothetical protein
VALLHWIVLVGATVSIWISWLEMVPTFPALSTAAYLTVVVVLIENAPT